MRKKYNDNQQKTEFSKMLLIQESMLIWVVTIAFLVLAFVCVYNGYFGELSWLTAMAALPWTAYAVSQGFYYKKAEKENTVGGIKYDSIINSQKSQSYSPYSIDEDETIIPEEDYDDSAVG